MFDLEKPAKKTPVKKAPVDKEKLLKDYIEVPYEQWAGIKKQSFIRYERKDGTFRKGGYVNSIWKSKSVGKSGTLYMKLSNRPYRGAVWVLNLDEVTKIWKSGVETPASNQEKEIAELKKTIESMKQKQKDIIAVIKRLHPSV